MKLLGFTIKDAATQMTEWRFIISHMTVRNQWNKYKNKNLGNHRENFAIKQSMIYRVKFDRWKTAAALSRDKDLNPDGVSADIIDRVLNEAGLYAYTPTVVAAISDVNKEKRLNFIR